MEGIIVNSQELRLLGSAGINQDRPSLIKLAGTDRRVLYLAVVILIDFFKKEVVAASQCV